MITQEEYEEAQDLVWDYEDQLKEQGKALDTSDETALNIDLVSGCFYWVKQTETCEYEPAIAECRYEKGVLYFCFTCGGAIRCDRVVDYKRLNNR